MSAWRVDLQDERIAGIQRSGLHRRNSPAMMPAGTPYVSFFASEVQIEPAT